METNYRKGKSTPVRDPEKNVQYADNINMITQRTSGRNLVVLSTGSIMPDDMIAKRIFEKDTSALSELYDLHSKYLYTIIFYILRDDSEAEDMLQEVFLQIWEKIGTYDETLGSLLAWITRITRNKSIDRLRSKGFKNRSSETDFEKFFDISSDSDSTDPEKILTLNQEVTLISKAINSLSHNQKKLIFFAYFRGYSQSELAEHFNVPLGTVKTRIRAAMMLLRKKLSEIKNTKDNNYFY